MAGKEIPISVSGFRGLNLREPAAMIGDDELVECKNLDIGRNGEVTRRRGFAEIHDGTTFGLTKVQLLEHFIVEDSGIYQILAVGVDNGHFYHSTDGVTWTDEGNKGSIEWAVQYDNKIYLIDTGYRVRTWDGTTFSTEIANSPYGEVAIAWKDRLFVMGAIANKNRLYFSEPGDFTSWPATNFIDVSPGDGDVLTAIAVIHDLLVLFKQRSTWGLYVSGAPSSWTLRNQNPEIGCMSKFTPREIEGLLYFVGHLGIYRTDGTGVEEISADLEPVFAYRVTGQGVRHQDAAALWQEKYVVRLLVNAAPESARIFIYHLRTGGWTEYVLGNLIPNQIFNFLEVYVNAPRGLYIGSLSSGEVYRFREENDHQDAGGNYTCSMKTKDFEFGLPSLMKRGKWSLLDVNTDPLTDVTLIYTVDGSDQSPITTANVGGRKPLKLPGPGFFRTLQFKVSVASDDYFQFYSLTLWLSRKSRYDPHEAVVGI